jgi:U3 small nucleolar RNA-associated protein 12
LVWDVKTGELLSRWTASENNAQVTVIARNQADPDVFGVGYDDGRIRIWLYSTATVYTVFDGHKSGITSLAFDHSGVRLASGSRDTDIILWNLVTEVGLFKLRGHKDQVTSLSFLRSHVEPYNEEDRSFSGEDAGTPGTHLSDENCAFLLSTSKDALLKLWDLSTQYCIETHIAQSNGECWALGLSPDQSGCITAGNDGELRAWIIDNTALPRAARETLQESPKNVLHDRGSFYRHSRDRTIGISFHRRKDFIAIHGSEKAIEIWRIRSDPEIQKSLSRKRRRKREKATEAMDDDEENTAADRPNENAIDISSALISDVFVPYLIVRTGGKVRSMDWAGGKSGKSVSLLAATSNNQVEVYHASVHEKKKLQSGEPPDYYRNFCVDMPGHRTDIRCLALSSDDRMLLSASHGSLKIWNVRTQNCIRTLDCGYALCAAFLPGDKIVVLGTKEGKLEIFDIASSTLLETLPAHERDIWSLHVHPDGKSLVTGSADKSAKFWDFRIVQEEILGTTRTTPRLTLAHTRTLKVSDDILSIRLSPDARFLAIATFDHTVKVFFVDSLKLFLTLYGHKLPVLSMDISYDSKLIVTSSADKNVRIWGLDFGDCHKAFFAHQDSILSVGFVPNNADGNGHHFFSVSKDKMIKYYDGDKFEQIQKLQGHHGEIWAMAIAHSGQFVVTASHDKSIRVWAQTDEQVFLEEEREKELEELYESTLVTGLEQDEQDAEGQDGETGEKMIGAGKQTVETLMAGEKIAEALEIGMEDLEIMREYEETRKASQKAARPQRNPVFLAHGGVSASVYVLGVFQRIPAASLQDALLVLSFSQLPALLAFLALWAREGRNLALTCRVLFFMLKVHQRQVVSSGQLRKVLEEVRLELRRRLKGEKEELGFNLAGVRVLGRRVAEEAGERAFVDGAEGEVGRVDTEALAAMGTGTKKRAFVNVA